MSKSLYYRLLEADLEMDHHESDLYVLRTTEAEKIIGVYEAEPDASPTNKSGFIGTDGRAWIELPFSFSPYWEQKSGMSSNHEEDDAPGFGMR